VRDKVADEYCNVFSSKNDQTAIRTIIRSMRDVPDVVMTDHELYFVGNHDLETGCITAGSPVLIEFPLIKALEENTNVVKFPKKEA